MPLSAGAVMSAGPPVQRDSGERLAHDALGHERRRVRRADAARDHLDDVRADELELGGDRAHPEQQLARGHPAGLRGAGAGDERRVEHVDVDGQVGGPRPDGRDRAPDDLADAEVADVVREQARDPALCLPRELPLPRPVAAQADLRVAPRVELAGVDQPPDERPVRALDAEDLGARVGVGVEVHHADGPMRCRDGPDGGLGDRVVAAEHDGDCARGQHLADGRLDRGVRALGVGGDHGRIAEVDHPQLGERIDVRLQVRAGRGAGGADRPWGQPCPGAVGDEVVHRRADDRHVEAGQLPRVLRVGRAGETQQAGVVGLLPVLRPALQRVDHGLPPRGVLTGIRPVEREDVDGLELRVAGAVQARAALGELAQVGDGLGGDALARQQGRHPGRVARDRLARDAADRGLDRDLLGGAEEGLARRQRHLVAQRRPRRDDRRGGTRLGEPLDGLLDVSGEAPQRGDRLPQSDDEDDRRLHRQLQVDVVGAAQCVRDLVTGAAGAAHVSTIRSGSYPATPIRPISDPSTSVMPSIVSSFARATSIASSVSNSSCSPCSASWRRAPSSEASSSEEGLVERSSRSARPTAPTSIRSPSPTCSIALWVNEPAILCVLVSIASALWDSAVGGSASWKPKCGPQDWSTTSGTPAACATSASAATSAAMPKYVGDTTNAALASGASRSACSSAAGVTQCVMPRSSSYSGATKLGSPPLSTSPSTIEACELRCATIRVPSGASARQSAWLPCVAPLVRNQDRAAPNALAASSSARSYGVGAGPRSIPWMSCGTSAASASAPIALRTPGSAPGPPLWPGTWKRAGPRKAYATTASRYGAVGWSLADSVAIAG